VASLAGTNVIGIEPDAENCVALRGNIDRNRLHNVVVFHGAVSPQPALLAMARRSPGNSGTVAVVSDRPAPGTGSYWIGSVPLQDLLNALAQPKARPVLIKIDVEGMEIEAIEGAADTLVRCRPAVMVEWFKSDQPRLREALENHGYRVFDMGLNLVAVHTDDRTLTDVAAGGDNVIRAEGR